MTERNLKQKAYRDAYYHKFRRTNEGKIYNRVASHNQWLTNQGKESEIIETPADARRKYKESGYIPTYVKNDDIDRIEYVTQEATQTIIEEIKN